MKVAQIMNRNVVTCRVEDNLAMAARAMWDRDIGCLPVLGADGHLAGVITDRDICMAAYTQGLPLPAIAVASAMSRDVFSCLTDDSLIAAEEVMRAHKVRRLPVMDQQGQLAGILSLNDLAIEAARQQGKQGKELSEREVAVTLAAVCEHRPQRALIALAS